MVKVYDFIVSEVAHRWKKQYPELWKEYHQSAVSTKQIEEIINKECKDIVSINTNTYIAEHCNNGDSNEVHIVFTVVCK